LCKVQVTICIPSLDNLKYLRDCINQIKKSTKIPVEIIVLDLGNDGNNEYTFTGRLNSTTSPAFVNLTPTANMLNTIKISSATAGLIMLDQFKVNSSINPVSLNKTLFENCYNCSINFTFSGNNLNVLDLKFDFLGSWNFTAIARYGTLKINQTIQVFYSNFNASLPKNVNWYDVFPSSNSAKNVTPYKQTKLTPIWNVTNQAYDEKIDIYVKTNETMNVCLNVTYMNSSNQSNLADTKFKLNTTYQKILTNISVNLTAYPNKGLWNWWDLANCTSAFEIPYVYFSAICSECHFTNGTQLDRFNVITE